MYSVRKCFYMTTVEMKEGYVLEHNTQDAVSLLWVNRYLHTLSINSPNTSRQYAYGLAQFLNFLEKRNKLYQDADDTDIVAFLHVRQYETDENITSIVQRVSPESLKSYFAPVRGFYLFLFHSGQPTHVTLSTVKVRSGRGTYLQGITDTIPKADLIIDDAYRNGAPVRDYIRWYSDDQKDVILSHFKTIRDKAIFSISLDGFRIDEILSSQMGDYSSTTGVLTPTRSKRKPDGSELRSAPLSERSIGLLEDYLLNERSRVEEELYNQGKTVVATIFINLNRGQRCGKPVSYHNFLKILKRAAEKAGLDPSMIRTHSGRSTRANEIFKDRDLHPEKWTDEDILDLFGWKSMQSSDPYIHHNDPERQMRIAKKLSEMDEDRRRRFDEH